jgi:hypothetical protein
VRERILMHDKEVCRGYDHHQKQQCYSKTHVLPSGPGCGRKPMCWIVHEKCECWSGRPNWGFNRGAHKAAQAHRAVVGGPMFHDAHKPSGLDRLCWRTAL